MTHGRQQSQERLGGHLVHTPQTMEGEEARTHSIQTFKAREEDTYCTDDGIRRSKEDTYFTNNGSKGC